MRCQYLSLVLRKKSLRVEDINKLNVTTTKTTKTRKKKIWNKIKKIISLIWTFSLAGTYSGSRPFFMALCLSCCFCLSFNSLSCKDNHTGTQEKIGSKRDVTAMKRDPTPTTTNICLIFNIGFVVVDLIRTRIRMLLRQFTRQKWLFGFF